MLIHLEGTVTDDVINFDLPQIYFKQGQIVSSLIKSVDTLLVFFFLHSKNPHFNSVYLVRVSFLSSTAVLNPNQAGGGGNT